MKSWVISVFYNMFIIDFGDDEIKAAVSHFEKTLKRANQDFSVDDVMLEWRMLKKVLYKT